MNLWWVWHKIQITNDATPKECARERPSANSNGDSKFSSPSNASKHSVNFKFQGPLFRANVDIQECNMFNNSLKRLIIETLLYKWIRKSQSGKNITTAASRRRGLLATTGRAGQTLHHGSNMSHITRDILLYSKWMVHSCNWMCT